MKTLVLMAAVLSALQNPASAAPSAQTWDLNDVAILLPIPGSLEEGLAPSDSGEQGKLLPKTVIAKLPNPFVNNQGQEAMTQGLRVVSVRIDPCYELPSGSCRRMIRLGWQPFFESSDGMSAADAAVHTFYDLNDEEFSSMAKELRAIQDKSRASTMGKPLDVHPALKTKGYKSAFWTSLKNLLLAHCGEKRLTRMTFMTMQGRTNVWTFAGYERDTDKGGLTQIQIPRIGAKEQTVLVHAQPPLQFDGGMNPEPKGDPNFNELAKTTVAIPPAPHMKPAQEKLVTRAAAAAADILNSGNKKLTPETLDCVSCHMAQPVMTWMRRNQVTFVDALPQLTGSYDLTNTSMSKLTNQLRGLGYFGRYVAVSQRTIYDAAVSADQMNKDYAK